MPDGLVSRWLKEHSPVDEWIGRYSYKETNDYVKKVILIMPFTNPCMAVQDDEMTEEAHLQTT